MTEEDYLTRCVVDTNARRFLLYSNQGNEKIVECDHVDEFLSILNFCRATLDESTLVYTSPLVTNLNRN